MKVTPFRDSLVQLKIHGATSMAANTMNEQTAATSSCKLDIVIFL
jgi:hypothetical protein